MLTRTGMSVAEAGEYVVVVTSPMGEVTSRKVKVEVYPAPGITVQPVARRIVRGQTTSLTVTATGEGLSYQWRRGSLPVQGATSRTLSFPNAQGTDSGDYSVVVSNGAGSVTSEVVRLTVVVPPIMTMTSLPAAIVGQPYSVPLTGAREPTRFVMTGLPRGLAVAKSGMELVGRAQQAGIFPLRVQGSNAAGTSAAVVALVRSYQNRWRRRWGGEGKHGVLVKAIYMRLDNGCSDWCVGLGSNEISVKCSCIRNQPLSSVRTGGLKVFGN